MPEGLREYRRKEKLFYARLVAGAKGAGRGALWLPRRFARWAGQRVTIAVIPHSGRASRRIVVSRLAVGLALAAATGLLGFSIFATARYAVAAAGARDARRELAEAQVTMDAFRDRAAELAGSALEFETNLASFVDAARNSAAGQVASSTARSISGSDPAGRALQAAGLADLLNLSSSGKPGARELERLSELAAYLKTAAPYLSSAALLLSGQKDVLSEIPNIWPIAGGIGHISMYFGQNENPFSDGQWYLHNGIDISTFRTGDPVLAAADGKVIDVSYDLSLGNSVTIQHSHGFLTRYGHMRSFKVTKGMQVVQGQAIGTVGNTGKTTGPHLHYEVHLGTSVIDPLRFLAVREEKSR